MMNKVRTTIIKLMYENSPGHNFICERYQYMNTICG